MTTRDTSRRQQLAARLKSAVATAAIVGTLGGWMAFGTQQSTTAIVAAADAPTAAAVAQASTTDITTSTVVQPDLSSDTPPTTGVTPSTVPTATSAPTATSSPSTAQPAPVTRTRSSR